jgi:cyanoexosortase A
MKRSLKSEKFWLYASLISFAVFYLTLTWKTTENIDSVITNSLFWGAIFFRLWQRRDRLSFKSDLFSTTFGLFLLAIALIKSVSLYWFESIIFLPFTPFFGCLGLAAIASGYKELKQYWLELLLVCLLFLPSDTLGWLFNKYFHIQTLTAKFAAYLLYYLGFNITSQNQDVFLNLSTGEHFIASVNYSCTGVSMIMLMLKLTLLLESLLKMKRWQHFLFPIAAVAIGFVLGSIRVCIMTLLLPQPDKFNYWHGTDGAQIFSTAAILIFFGFCYLILNKKTGNGERGIVTKQKIIANREKVISNGK